MRSAPGFLRIQLPEGLVDILMIFLVAVLVLATWGLIRLCEKV